MKLFGMPTSRTEIEHIIKAWLAISLAFAILLSGGFSPGFEFASVFIIAAITVGLGFIAHELAHKYVAQKYGCHAEFRANFMMLIASIAMSFFGFLIAAPGAVMIQGNVGVPRNGRIAAAGPAANLVFAVLFLPLANLGSPFLTSLAQYGFMINAFLGLFNMIPFGVFDGGKIYRWNKKVYGGMVAIGFILLIIQPYLFR